MQQTNSSSTTEPSNQYTMMASHKQQQPLLPSQQKANDTDSIDASQKFYLGDCNTITPQPIMLKILPIMLLSNAQKFCPLYLMLCS